MADYFFFSPPLKIPAFFFNVIPWEAKMKGALRWKKPQRNETAAERRFLQEGRTDSLCLDTKEDVRISFPEETSSVLFGKV